MRFFWVATIAGCMCSTNVINFWYFSRVFCFLTRSARNTWLPHKKYLSRRLLIGLPLKPGICLPRKLSGACQMFSDLLLDQKDVVLSSTCVRLALASVIRVASAFFVRSVHNSRNFRDFGKKSDLCRPQS